MFSGQVRKILGVTDKTLKDWVIKGLIHFKENEIGWRVYDKEEVMNFKKTHVLSGQKSGRKLKPMKKVA